MKFVSIVENLLRGRFLVAKAVETKYVTYAQEFVESVRDISVRHVIWSIGKTVKASFF